MPQINTTLVAHGNGLGDMVCLAWIAEGTRETDDPITFYAKHGNYNILKLLGQAVADQPNDGWVSVGDCYMIEVKDRGSRLRLDYLRDFLGVTAPFKRPRVLLSPEDIEWAHRTKQELGGDRLVLLFPQALSETRAWPAAYWVDLAWQLNERKIAQTVLLAHEDKRFTNTPHYAWGLGLSQLAALMSVSSVVVCNDSGPAHLSGTIGTPTVVLSGPTRPQCVYGHVPEVTALASDAPPACTGCYFAPPYRPACDQGCQMLYALKRDVVLDRVLGELSHSGKA